MTDETTNAEVKKDGFFKSYFKCMKLDVRHIAINAVIAAMYAVLTYAFFFISYGQLQVRISEFMILLAFFNPNYIYGLTIGCIIANIYSPAFSAFCSPLDIIFGTMATFLAAVSISLCRHMFIATLFPAIYNGVLLGAEFCMTANNFSQTYFWTNFGYVALGEVIAVCVLGYIIFMILGKKWKGFYKLIDAKFNVPLKW